MRVRPATAKDLARIEEIVARAYGGYLERIGMRPGPMEDDYGTRVARGLVSVAVDDDSIADGGAIAGLIVLVREPESLLVENVTVDPGRQGEGVGRALLDFAEAEAARAGLDRLTLYTHEKMSENLVLYGRLGYRVDERREEGGFARVFLSKRLGDD
jgi:GNAT superfamily N-acetyltransferase